MRVAFFVDGKQVGTAESAPYAVTWVDENPFEAREIKVEAAHDSGATRATTVTLPAFEIEDQTEVGRILVEAGVYDAAGQPALRLAPADFHLRENGECRSWTSSRAKPIR